MLLVRGRAARLVKLVTRISSAPSNVVEHKAAIHEKMTKVNVCWVFDSLNLCSS